MSINLNRRLGNNQTPNRHTVRANSAQANSIHKQPMHRPLVNVQQVNEPALKAAAAAAASAAASAPAAATAASAVATTAAAAAAAAGAYRLWPVDRRCCPLPAAPAANYVFAFPILHTCRVTHLPFLVSGQKKREKKPRQHRPFGRSDRKVARLRQRCWFPSFAERLSMPIYRERYCRLCFSHRETVGKRPNLFLVSMGCTSKMHSGGIEASSSMRPS